MMNIEMDGTNFSEVLETAKSPKTCVLFEKTLPVVSQVDNVRWGGGVRWIPHADNDFEVGYEDASSYPAPGQILLYPTGKSETEILIAYGAVAFASKAGSLAGNHFATITSDLPKLREIGVSTLWQGAKDIRFSL